MSRAPPLDGCRWRFMMAALDRPEGPEAKAIKELGEAEHDESRPASEQMNDLCDRARALVAKGNKQ